MSLCLCCCRSEVSEVGSRAGLPAVSAIESRADGDPSTSRAIPIDDFSDGEVDSALFEHIFLGQYHRGHGSGASPETFMAEKNGWLETQTLRDYSESSGRVTNILQTKSGSRGDFIGRDVVIEAKVRWYANTLVIGEPPAPVEKVSIVDGIDEVVLWSAAHEPWKSGRGDGLRTKQDHLELDMEFDFDPSGNRVSFATNGEKAKRFDLSGLSAWLIRWTAEGQNLSSSHSSTARVALGWLRVHSRDSGARKLPPPPTPAPRNVAVTELGDASIYLSFDDAKVLNRDHSGHRNDLVIPGAHKPVKGVSGLGLALGGHGINHTLWVSCACNPGKSSLGPHVPVSGLQLPSPRGFTVSYWVQVDPESSVRCGGKGFGLSYVARSQKTTFVVDSTSIEHVYSVANEDWVHLAGVYSKDGDLTLYVEGEPVAHERLERPLQTAPAPNFFVSGSWHATQPSRLDEVVLFKRALSEPQIRMLAGL